MTENYISITPAEASYLLAEFIRLKEALADARLESANRLAAIRAALGAAADGESDPLAYLRDQLAEETATGSIGGGH
jgi:hypothetical protein